MKIAIAFSLLLAACTTPDAGQADLDLMRQNGGPAGDSSGRVCDESSKRWVQSNGEWCIVAYCCQLTPYLTCGDTVLSETCGQF